MIVNKSMAAALAGIALIAAAARSEAEETAPATPEWHAATAADRLLVAARDAFRAAANDLKTDPRALDRAYRASGLWRDAQRASATDADGLKAAFAGHRDRMRLLARARYAGRDDADASIPTGADVAALFAEAEFRAAGEGDPLRSDGPGDSNPKTADILKRLDEPLAMNFPNETPLEDVLKYVKETARTPEGGGIPIYVDPLGMSEAEKTTTSPVSIDLEGVPLRRTLQIMLKQLGLVYFVEDGVLVITSSESAETGLGPDMARPSPLRERIDKATRGEAAPEEMKELAERLKLIGEIQRARRALESAAGENPPDRSPAPPPASPDLGSKPLM